MARALRRPFRKGLRLLPRMGEVRVLVDPKALRRAKDRLRAITSRRWGVSMSGGSRRSTASRSDGRPTSGSADTPTPFEDLDEWLRRRLRQVRWGRTGSAPARGPATCERSVSPERTPVNGRVRARGTGGSPAPSPSPSRCPTATGPHSACRDSPIPTAASGMPSEPPDADPHVRWVLEGEPGAYPTRRATWPAEPGDVLASPLGRKPIRSRSDGQVAAWATGMEACRTIDALAAPPSLGERGESVGWSRKGRSGLLSAVLVASRRPDIRSAAGDRRT